MNHESEVCECMCVCVSCNTSSGSEQTCVSKHTSEYEVMRIQPECLLGSLRKPGWNSRRCASPQTRSSSSRSKGWQHQAKQSCRSWKHRLWSWIPNTSGSFGIEVCLKCRNTHWLLLSSKFPEETIIKPGTLQYTYPTFGQPYISAFHGVSMFVHDIHNLPEMHGQGVLPRCLGMTDKMWYIVVQNGRCGLKQSGATTPTSYKSYGDMMGIFLGMMMGMWVLRPENERHCL